MCLFEMLGSKCQRRLKSKQCQCCQLFIRGVIQRKCIQFIILVKFSKTTNCQTLSISAVKLSCQSKGDPTIKSSKKSMVCHPSIKIGTLIPVGKVTAKCQTRLKSKQCQFCQTVKRGVFQLSKLQTNQCIVFKQLYAA